MCVDRHSIFAVVFVFVTDSPTMSYFLDRLGKMYCPTDENDPAWTELRVQVLRVALQSTLIPMAKQVTQQKMLEFSQKNVANVAARELEFRGVFFFFHEKKKIKFVPLSDSLTPWRSSKNNETNLVEQFKFPSSHNSFTGRKDS